MGGVTLIKGTSGIGKTTALQGLAWCLYGNLRMVAPNHMEKAKTNVILEMPYTYRGIASTLIIDRRRNPNRLLLTHGGQQYEDKVAQAIIIDMFGSYDIWLASCYINQNARNTFLTAPNSGKMELLNTIAFHQEDPTEFIERIDSEITSTNLRYANMAAVFNEKLQEYTRRQSQVDTTKAFPPETSEQYQATLAQLSEQITALNQQQQQRQIDLGILANLQQQLQTLRNEPAPAPPQLPNHILELRSRYGITTGTTIPELEAEVETAQNMIPALMQRDSLVNNENAIRSRLLPYVNSPQTSYTQADCEAALAQEAKCQNAKNIVHSLGLLYSQSAIDEALIQHRTLLQNQERWKLMASQTELTNQLQQLISVPPAEIKPLPVIEEQTIPAPDYSAFATDGIDAELSQLSERRGTLTAHIQHLEQGRDVLTCPQCTTPLRHENGQLVQAETTPLNPAALQAAQQELQQISQRIQSQQVARQSLVQQQAQAQQQYQSQLAQEQQRLTQLRAQAQNIELANQRIEMEAQTSNIKIEEIRAQLASLQLQLEAMPQSGNITSERKILSPQELERTHSIVGRLENITFEEPPPISSATITESLQHQQLQHEAQIAHQALEDHVATLPVQWQQPTAQVQQYISGLQAYITAVRSNSDDIVRRQQREQSLLQQIEQQQARISEDAQEQLNTLATHMQSIQRELALSDEAHSVLHQYTAIMAEREKVVELNAKISNLNVFRQHAVDTECRILEQIVDSINNSIENVCETLFDANIGIRLDLFKTAKTTKNVKPQANFKIAYRGGTFDNINQMSGGEGDRASLALTLALNRLASCPLLMLDESLASLDLDMKEAAVRTIREQTNHTVLIILHDGIEGIFDHVINMNEQ